MGGDAADKNAKRGALSRRELMKLVGAGLAVSTLPELASCIPPKPGPDENVLANGAQWVEIGRRDDLVKLRLGLVGFEVRPADKIPPPDGTVLAGNLYLGRTTGPAYIMVDHPPQHFLEEAWIEPTIIGPPTPGTVPVTGQLAQHRIARFSRLTFFVPDALLAIPYELEPILTTLSTLQLHVADNAYDEPSGGRIGAPSFGPGGAALPMLGASTRIKGALRSARTRARAVSYQGSNPEVSAATQTQPDARNGPEFPTPPTALSTQIEIPFRLIISPNRHATWEHAAAPVASKAGRVELWHTRMGAPEGWMRTIRAIDTRDAGFNAFDPSAGVAPSPFRSSLTSQNRADLVHVTTNYTLKDDTGASLAKAVKVDKLMLSSLGGWLDAHGEWALRAAGPALALWDHHAVMGRDQKVQVADYGYLYPFGHVAILVTVTERKFKPGYEEAAFLWQHSFVVVKEPIKTYDGATSPLGRKFPFTSVRFKTLITPTLDEPPENPIPSMPLSRWVKVGGQAFPFEIEAFDHDGNSHAFTSPCIFLQSLEVAKQFPPMGSADVAVANAWANADAGARRSIAMKSQRVALAPSDTLDDTSYSIRSMAHTAVTSLGLSVPFVPQLDVADIALDAARALSGNDVATKFKYLDTYVANGFDALNAAAAKNVAGVFMGLANTADDTAKLLLSGQADKSGGFVSPDMVISGLSRAQGVLSGDPTQLLGMAPTFDPASFFSLIGAKLFGILSLSDLIEKVVGPDVLKQAPKFVSQALDVAELVFHTFENASSLVDDLKARLVGEFKVVLDTLSGGLDPSTLTPVLQQLYARVKSKAAALGVTPSQLQSEFTALTNALDGLGTAAVALASDLEKVASIDGSTDVSALADDIISNVSKARDALTTLGTTLKSLVLPIDEGIKAQVLKLYDAIVVKILPSPSALDDFKLAVKAFVNAEEAIKDQHVSLDWAPTISGFPVGNEIFWPNDKHGFRLGVDLRGKASGGHPAGATVFASLTDFELRLIGKNDIIKLVFDKLVFKAGSDGKAIVDVGFRGVHFGGPLSFVETIRQFIPLDGFSDPPSLQVSPQGISARYSLPLPNVAIGVFSLENLSISAGFDIPFIGKSLSVSFAFCSRESPFILTVCMLGGGGFVGLTLAPDGVRLLEISLEAQACLAVDFGVASGSVSIALGLYFAIEADDCKLTGYLRMRGCVQVLGIIHASIELKLELSYESSTGKVVGRASLEIEVSVFCFSVSVTIETEKKFSGGNSDPTFRQVMAYDLPSGYAPWDEYCSAFTLVAP